ncbi:unnamed protein product [Closterium sp. Yama58-4]|nr:unnamed protein product [Closterium sp. Yama58-4]
MGRNCKCTFPFKRNSDYRTPLFIFAYDVFRLLAFAAKNAHPQADINHVETVLQEAEGIVMGEHQIPMLQNSFDSGIYIYHYLKALVDSSFETVREWIGFRGVSALQYRRSIRTDICEHAEGKLLPKLAELGINVPPQNTGTVTDDGTVVQPNDADVRAKLAKLHTEVQVMEREVTILKARVIAIGQVLGYTQDQLLVAAAYVLQQSGTGGSSKSVGAGINIAPSTPQQPLGNADYFGFPRSMVFAMPETGRVATLDSDDDAGKKCTSFFVCKSGSTQLPRYTGVRRERTTGKWGVKLLVMEDGVRSQIRLGAYTSKEEAAYAYAAAAFVTRPEESISDTKQLSAAEKRILDGCNKGIMRTLARARKWWRWREWRKVYEEEERKGADGNQMSATHSCAKRRKKDEKMYREVNRDGLGGDATVFKDVHASKDGMKDSRTNLDSVIVDITNDTGEDNPESSETEDA